MKVSYYPDESLTQFSKDCDSIAIEGKVAHAFSEENTSLEVFDFASLKIEAKEGYVLSGTSSYYYEHPRKETT